MSDTHSNKQPTDPQQQPVQPWVTPEITDLPPLTDLTLQTGIGPGIPGRGGIGGGGSTVF